MSIQEVLQLARQQWGAGLESTPRNIHAAAVGLVSNWYRNTDAVETLAHAEGPWSDADMLRKNAWATHLARRAIADAAAVVDAPESLEDVLACLLEELIAILPNDRAKRSLRSEKRHAPSLAAAWVQANGLGNWLAFLTSGPLYPSGWWGVAQFPAIVDQYCRLDPGPPDAESFRTRMLEAPWELTDEQAEFVCRHRYDLG